MMVIMMIRCGLHWPADGHHMARLEPGDGMWAADPGIVEGSPDRDHMARLGDGMWAADPAPCTPAAAATIHTQQTQAASTRITSAD